MRSCASWKRSCEKVGLTPKVWYSAPIPRTKPVIRRPPLMTSIIACSSATISGCERSGSAPPRNPKRARLRRRAAGDRNAGAFRAPRQRRRGDDRRWHKAIGSLVVLVHRDDVETQLLAVLQLVEVAVVEPVALLRIEVAVRQRDPYGAVLAPRREIEIRVGHEVKKD